jgi:ferredoxin/flavodoxin---NADP+ reductase
MAKPLEYNATLVEREDLTPALGVFRVRPDEALPGAAAWFVPGQYMVLGLNNEVKVELGGVRRPMSIASAPERRDLVEFYIRYVEKPESENPFTHLLWTRKAGDRMYVRVHPTGKFTVPDTVGAQDRRLKVCVAAGTGLAPFLSMVRSEYNQDPTRSLSDYVIIHGASYSADLGYREELDMLVQKCGLRYLPTVSRPQQDPNWRGHTGRAEGFFAPDRLAGLEDILGLPPGGFLPSAVQILICGLQGTIGTCIEQLVPRGFVPDNRKIRRALEIGEEHKPTIFYEAYDTIPPIDLEDAGRVAGLKAAFQAAIARQ